MYCQLAVHLPTTIMKELGQQFLERVTSVLEQATTEDPSLLQHEKSALLMEQVERYVAT